MESPRTGRVVSADSKDLQKRWLVLAATLGVAADEAMQWWDTIQSAYTEPTRYYHTLDHVRELLRLCDLHAKALTDKAAVELAVYFHDVVYDARRGSPSNEHESAMVFDTFAARAPRLSAARMRAVHDWIVRTANHRCKETDALDCRLFMDMDMAVLARQPFSCSAAHAAQPRAEYRHHHTLAFNWGRSAFLHAFAKSKEPIYTTPQFAHLEAPARANALVEAAALRRVLAMWLLQALFLAAACAACVAPYDAWRYHSPLLRAAGAAALALRGLWWLLIERTLYPFPYHHLPTSGGGVGVLAASFNPPHNGHLALLKALAARHERVHAVVSVNASKTYAVPADARADLLREMIAAAGPPLAGRVEVHVVSGYVWRHAAAAGASCLYRGIRSWAADGFAEKHLELLNTAGPILLGPLVRPVPTRHLGADPRYIDASSTLVRKGVAARGAAGVEPLVPPGFAEKLVELYK